MKYFLAWARVLPFICLVQVYIFYILMLLKQELTIVAFKILLQMRHTIHHLLTFKSMNGILKGLNC